MKTLVREAPQTFAGEQGLYLKTCSEAQPMYVLKKRIPLSTVRSERRPHDLRVCVVLWSFPHATALTVYNNYLDSHAAEWRHLNDVVTGLQPFHEVTLVLEGLAQHAHFGAIREALLP